jgi:hypothetical protein
MRSVLIAGAVASIRVVLPGLAVGYVTAYNPFGLPERTADEGGQLLWSLRHYAAHGVSVAFQINTDAGFLDDSSDLVPTLEAALADLAIEAVR